MTMSIDDPTRAMFEFSAGPFTGGELTVVSFRGTEELSRPYAFEIVLATSTVEPARMQTEVLGAAARLTFASADGSARRIHGVVRAVRAEQFDPEHGRRFWTVHLVPRLWLLRQRKRNRIFQNQSVPEIVGAVLRDVGVANRFHLSHERAPREYCAQYRETDLAFVTRLLAEEGIFYFFVDPPAGEPTGELVIFGDLGAHYIEAPRAGRLTYRDGADLRHGDVDVVHAFSRGDELGPGALRVQHFDFRRPTTEIVETATASASATREEQTALHFHEYDGEMEQDRVAPDVADTWLGALRASCHTALGETKSRRILPGAKFTLVEHPDEALNRGWAIVKLEHEGNEPAAAKGEPYQNRMVCVPADVAARPKRPRRRLQQVMETAMVVGPPGEEIHTDELGRIKVQFHWDEDGQRDEHASCWLRVMHTWAGSAWGFQFLPRIGMEVVVSFVGGDTDRPMVLGTTYNGTSPPPYPLPKSKTVSGIRSRSTPGGGGHHEISFEDAAGKERLFVHATRDLEELVEHDHSRTVHENETVNVGGARETSIGKDHVRHVQGSEIVTVEKSLVMHVVGQYVLRVDGGDATKKGADQAQQGAQTGAPGPAALGPASTLAAAEDRARELGEAKLKWLVASLPEALRSDGAELESATLDAAHRTSELGPAVASLERRANQEWGSVVSAVQSGETAATEPLAALAQQAGELGEKVAEARDAAAKALARASAEAAAELKKAQAAAAERLDAASAEAARLEGSVARAKEQISRAEVLAKATQSAEYASKGPFGGSGKGGGGIPDSAPPSAPVAGTTLDITGGGHIKGDKFKIEAGGCTINMEGGVLTIDGPQVVVTGKPIKLN
jgi:type VI secretion system secreted protein VgrG